MNNKELAINVFKHPLIQEILKRKIAEPSLINQLIVQEVLNEELNDNEKGELQYLLDISKNEKEWPGILQDKDPDKGAQAHLDMLNRLMDKAEEGELNSDELKKLEMMKKALLKATGADTGSDLQGIAGMISEVVKESIAERTGPWVNKALRKIPVIGQGADYLDSAMEFFGVGSLGENVVKGLLKPIDSMIGGLWEAVGAAKLEQFVREIVGGEEKYEALINTAANSGTEGVKSFLKKDALQISRNFIVAMSRTFKDQFQAVSNFKVGGYPVGNFFLSYLLDERQLELLDDIPDPAQDDEQQPEVEGFYAKLAELEKNQIYDGATDAFKKLDAVLLKGLLREFNDNPVYAKLFNKLPDDLKDKLQTAMESLNDREQEKVLAVLNQDGMIDLYVGHLESKITTPVKKPEETGTGTENPNEQELENAVEQGTNEQNISSDFDQSDPEVPNLRYDEYRNSLDWFFGMRDDKKTSFMKAFFLSFQVKLLHENLLASLNSIINPPEFGERALSRVGDELEEQQDPEAIPVTPEEDNIELSRKNKISLKRELADQADILLDAKKIAKAYISYGTQRSVDARFDGSSLEKQLKVILGAVQMHNARLVSIMSNVANEYQKQQDVVKEQTEVELTRDQKIDKIEQVYKEMGNFYKNNLRISLENKDFKQATQAAKKMLEMIKPIIPFFPKTIVSNTTGKVVSLADAVRNLEGKIESYKKVLRDIYMNIKDDEVSPIQISRALIQLKQLCESIDEEFNVPCQINETELKKAQGKLPPQESALTDEPVDEEIPVVEPEQDTETGTNDQEETEPEDQEELAVEKFQISNPQAVNEFLKNEYGPNKFQDFTPEEYRTLIRLFVATKIEKKLNEHYNTIKSLDFIDKNNAHVLNDRLHSEDRERLKEMGIAKIKQFFEKANKIYKLKPFNVISDADREELNKKFNLKIMNRDFYEQIAALTNENLISTLEPIIEQMLRGKNG